MKYTKETIEQIIKEAERRAHDDFYTSEWNQDYNMVTMTEPAADMYQGVCGTLMVTADNWPEVTRWLDEVIAERWLIGETDKEAFFCTVGIRKESSR